MNMQPPLDSLRVVCHDPHIGLSALFRLYAKETRPKLDVEYQPAGGKLTLHFRGPDALGLDEQTLMLVLLELAQEWRWSADHSFLKSDSPLPEGQTLWKNLYQQTEGIRPETLWFPTSWYELARRTGKKSYGGSVVAPLKKQLKRLCECVVWERYTTEDGDTTEFQSFLMAMTYSDDKRLFVALNVRLSDAIVSHRYMPVSLAERLQLKSTAAK
ncbi:replication protein C, IncQ-type [Variovorax ureilyticus]|uniref:replication protein C, IncQ-type n=1 Tax=Variovorax ureilyticus TaxID=1836198 RepID=UPI003D67D963